MLQLSRSKGNSATLTSLYQIVDSLQQCMKVQDTEPNMGEILCCYIKVKVSNLCQYVPNLSMELSSADKAQDNIGWGNMMWGRISCHCNKRQS